MESAASVEDRVAQRGEPQTETNVWPSRPRLGESLPEARGFSGLTSKLANSPENRREKEASVAETKSQEGAPSYPGLVGRGSYENPNIHAAGNNVTTTREVSSSEPKSTGVPRPSTNGKSKTSVDFCIPCSIRVRSHKFAAS